MERLNYNVVELSSEESLAISGGDKFLYDLGNSIGRFANWLSNISYPTESYSSVMLRRGV